MHGVAGPLVEGVHVRDQPSIVEHRGAPGHPSEVRRLIFDHLSSADVRPLQRMTKRILQAAKPDACLTQPPTAPLTADGPERPCAWRSRGCWRARSPARGDADEASDRRRYEAGLQ